MDIEKCDCSTCMGDPLTIKKPADTDKLIKQHGGKSSIKYLAISGSVQYPIYQFWRLHKEKTLAHLCHVVFVNIDEKDPGWGDLVTSFGGTVFLKNFLMRVSENARPSVVPSQRGMYIR